jgi:hypothetical protein
MIKFEKPQSIYGILEGDSKRVFLGIVESEEEVNELVSDYIDVFGVQNIHFHKEETPAKFYAEEKMKAFMKLFGVLNTPMQNVFTNLRNIKR